MYTYEPLTQWLSAQSLLKVLALLATASVVSSLIYFAFRAFESRFRIVSLVINILIISFFLLSLATSIMFPDLIFLYVLAIIVSLFGGSIHRNSKPNPSKFPPAFILMSAVTLTSLAFALILIGYSTLPNIIVFASNQFAAPYSDYAIYILLMAQSLFSPLLIWIVKNSRLRPGVDKHLES